MPTFNSKIGLVIALLFLCFPTCNAQVLVGGAHANLYFPHLADGGSQAYKFQTTLIFLNGNPAVEAHVKVRFFSDLGAPLALNFGQGNASTMDLSIPAGGTKTLTSSAASTETLTGWALAVCDQPVQGTLQFRGFVNGTPQQAVSALAGLPGLAYVSPATYLTGVALANVYNSPTTLAVSVTDNSGNAAGQSMVTVPPNGHVSFNLNGLFPSLPTSFGGSISVESTSTAQPYFVGWTLAVDNSGVFSSYAPGTTEWPISHVDRTWDVYYRDLASAQKLADSFNLGIQVNSQTVPLHIQNDAILNAYATKSDNSVNIEVALSELVSDSPSELAFAVAHEIGHTMQFRAGKNLFNPNPENDADMWGMLISMGAGYDPYAAAGTLAKLSMAMNDAGLVSQTFDNFSGDLHGSFNNRIQLVFSSLKTACEQPSITASCAAYKSVIHPHFPGSVPLDKLPVAPLKPLRP